MQIAKACGVAAVMAMCLGQLHAQGPLTITVLSSRPDLVSGGNALVQIAPTGDGLTVSVNGQDLTTAFREEGGRLIGLVEGLRDGRNVIEARRGTRTARLEVTNHPVKNSKGARCTMWDTNVASFGRDPATGFARRSLDNVGVQYGLDALNRGVITPAEFLDLNETIGGFDNDGVPRPARTVADPEAVRLAYATGRLNSGAGGLATVPILHYRSYNDPTGDIHDRFRDFTMRERLRQANGHADNQVIWVYPNGVTGLGARVAGLAVDTMAEWLDTLAGLKPAPSVAQITRAKPAAAVDGCWDASGTRIDEPATFDGPGRCNALYPNHKNPRLIAGAQLTDDVLKCQLKPIDRRDYEVTFAASEMTRLGAIFPAGVCDYSKVGVAQVPLAGTYQRLPLTAPVTSRRD